MATALLLGSLVMWMRRHPRPTQSVVGALLAVAAALVRPQWAPALAPLFLWAILGARGRATRTAMMVIPVIAGVTATIITSSAAGGSGALLEAVRAHAAYVSESAAGFSWGFWDLGLHAVAGSPALGVAWLGLTTVGVVVMAARASEQVLTWPLLLLALAPQVALVFVAHNPTIPRYWLAPVALSAIPILVALDRSSRSARVATAVIAAATGAALAAVGPSAWRTGHTPSPVSRAFSLATSRPGVRVLAVDNTLVAFVAYGQARGEIDHYLVWDEQIERGLGAGRGGRELATIMPGTAAPRWLRRPDEIVVLSCSDPLLRRVAAPRLMDVTVAFGGRISPGAGRTAAPP